MQTSEKYRQELVFWVTILGTIHRKSYLFQLQLICSTTTQLSEKKRHLFLPLVIPVHI